MQQWLPRLQAQNIKKLPGIGYQENMTQRRQTGRMNSSLGLLLVTCHCQRAASHPSTEMVKDTYGNISDSPAPPSPS